MPMDPERKTALRLGAAALVLVVGGIGLARFDWRGWRDPMPREARELAEKALPGTPPAVRGSFAFGQGTSLCMLEPWYDGTSGFLQRIPRAGDGFGDVPVDLGRIHPLGQDVTQDVLDSAFCQRGRGSVFYRLHYADRKAGEPYLVSLTAWQDAPLGMDQAHPKAVFAARIERSGWTAKDFGDGPERKNREAAVRRAAIDDNRLLSDALGVELGIVLPPRRMAEAPVAGPWGPYPPKPKNAPASWVTKDDYPALALKEKREGTTRIRVGVGPDGRVRVCEIVASSGHDDLDTATCDAIRRQARFYPARDASGRLIGGTYAQAVRWRIPDD